MTRLPIGIALLLVCGALALRVGGVASGDANTTEPTFPHARHQRLFPVCEGCHAGLVNGVTTEIFPDTTDCVRCHDGERAKRVAWQQRSPRASNLRFSHAAHREQSARTGEAAGCRSCHATGGAPGRMSVEAAGAAHCIGCHEHRADTHLAGSALCARCHVPVWSATTMPVERVARFPKPEWHRDDTYVSTHGARAADGSCAVCHARETCERCHANAERLPEIIALERDARVAALEAGRQPTYPKPASHDVDWNDAHGVAATANAASCANCHTRTGCIDCHQRGSRVVASLPAARGTASGVAVRGAAHTAEFRTRHSSAAAAGRNECLRCHTEQTCAGCHAGSDSRAFHGANFVERHASDVFASNSECQSCHSTETFCRSCHARAGIAARPGMNAAFHNGQPMWVLTHGQAARTGLEACASCHRQQDCMRCHSAAGGWGVNPHAPGYSADRLAARNRTTCRWCHLTSPIGTNP